MGKDNKDTAKNIKSPPIPKPKVFYESFSVKRSSNNKTKKESKTEK